MGRGFLAVSIAITVSLAASTSAQDPDRLPAPITKYYEDRNFVSLLSNPGDRARIVAFTRLSEEAKTKAPLSPQLATIDRLMAKVEWRVVKVDPPMNITPGGGRETLLDYDQILEVRETRDFKGGLIVRVKSCSVDSKGRTLLISVYEGSGGNERELPSDSERLRLGSGQICHDEIHYWNVVGGEWLTQSAHAILVNGIGQ